MARMNIRISGLGGQGAVTAAHLLAMAANRDGKFSISNGSINNGVNNQNLFAEMDVDNSRLSKKEASLLAKKQGPINAKALIDLVSRAVKEGMFK